MKIRCATAADVEALADLLCEFYAESNYSLDRERAARSCATLIENPSYGTIWLITVGGAPAGHAVMTVRYAMEYGGLIAHVDDMYVRPAFRRLGAATAVLAELLEECKRRGCRSLQVEPGESNVAAVALYSRFGLKKGGDGRLLLSSELGA